ncbi:uncharacterized protein LOC126455980 [Schistocerca serialis cubense]|uniref:uncharacterized protein LOC126455980 n=1 Tax=Schistocerca serialis cubense TaxID=2023355 RepID=UPI00214F1C7B|nr:uncharacterized protein LOC126455980 [Schistocerca serialis cubense]
MTFWYLDVKQFISIPGLTLAIYFLLLLLADLKLLLTFSVCTVTRLGNLRSFIKQLIIVDKNIQVVGTECNKWLPSILLIIHIALLIAVGLVVLDGQLLRFFHALFHCFIDSVVVLQFVALVLELWIRFCKINTCLLEELYHPEVGVVQLLPQSPAPACRLRQLRESYVSLGRAAELLGEHFGLPVALDVGLCVLGTTCSAYELLVMLERPHLMDFLPFSQSVSLSVLWLAYQTLKLVALTLSCAAAQDVAERTGILLRRSPVLPPGISAEMDAFLRVTSRDPPLRFTAWGFVNIDRNLLVSAFGVVITYLVVISQSLVK